MAVYESPLCCQPLRRAVEAGWASHHQMHAARESAKTMRVNSRSVASQVPSGPSGLLAQSVSRKKRTCGVSGRSSVQSRWSPPSPWGGGAGPGRCSSSRASSSGGGVLGSCMGLGGRRARAFVEEAPLPPACVCSGRADETARARLALRRPDSFTPWVGLQSRRAV
ncbi:uncharacterized protein CC84DRAFT_739590 [Paraphaeosphaeria sporulosa]|uniref:Uncharacterized protein n=1 Tax=Paraphaeosphaeria sporulosa TaxID=1460663 RepID=A0A177CGJ5_9PLEO|nr:uncharacterized protein CC84DRAFT_739590 [Paraphaeosphaeria sporulosa]OAG05880.1 hypothetical protein CC84DRAFT_739590 [Paraphaeosphaeria sporulosa]